MDQKNLIVAIALSISIILGWQVLYVAPREAEQRAIAAKNQPAQPATPAAPGSTAPSPAGGATPAVPGGGAAPLTAMSRPQALAAAPRIKVQNGQISGSISLRGARIDDVNLLRHRETVDRNSSPVHVLSPEGAANAYYAEFGWSTTDPAVKVPGPQTVWNADGDAVTPGRPVTLSWDNGEGVLFKLRLEVDADFLFTVTQSVENKSDKALTLFPYGLAVRHGEPKTEGIYLLHEGPYGVFDGKLKELSYSDVKPEVPPKNATTGGWIGFTDKYWMTVLIPDQKTKVDTTFRQTPAAGGLAKRYQADYLAPAIAVAPGATAESKSLLYAGAKIVETIDRYEEKYGIVRFDLTIDWGWFSFFTKPLFWLLHGIYYGFNIGGFSLPGIGNFGVSILILTVLVKLAFYPLAQKSYESMTRMKKMQPELEKLRERYKGDPQSLNKEMMGLYKREKVNPAAGCLPVLLQIPVFFALYKVLYTSIEMRHQPFFGWIQDLSAPDPATILTAFGFLPWNVPELLSFFNIGIWPLIMGMTMYLQQMMNPQPADPIQARMFQFLPILFTFMLAPFAAGLVIYWTWNNLLSMLQQYIIMRKLGVPIELGLFGKKKKPA